MLLLVQLLLLFKLGKKLFVLLVLGLFELDLLLQGSYLDPHDLLYYRGNAFAESVRVLFYKFAGRFKLLHGELLQLRLHDFLDLLLFYLCGLRLGRFFSVGVLAKLVGWALLFVEFVVRLVGGSGMLEPGGLFGERAV